MIKKNNSGYSLVELLVVIAIFTVISTAGTMLFLAGQSAWSVTDVQARIQENLRNVLLRVPAELQESGTDKNGVLQVSIQDNIGVNGSDILHFSVPICPCGVNVIDENGYVRSWGAPLIWGQSGCNSNYTVESNNKVDICHVPPGNPNNKHDLSVGVNAVKAHLAHGDWLGDCNACDPDNFNNKKVEYLLDANGELLRRVLTLSDVPINSVVYATDVTDFQVSLNPSNTVVTLFVQISKKTEQNRVITKSASVDVLLRN